MRVLVTGSAERLTSTAFCPSASLSSRLTGPRLIAFRMSVIAGLRTEARNLSFRSSATNLLRRLGKLSSAVDTHEPTQRFETMKSCMCAVFHQHQVFDAVIQFVLVDVVQRIAIWVRFSMFKPPYDMGTQCISPLVATRKIWSEDTEPFGVDVSVIPSFGCPRLPNALKLASLIPVSTHRMEFTG